MFRNKNKGFSLIELIVVIAILVVFAAVLIPSLLQYTENSRAQKDVSAMDEVVNAFQLAMADQDCYDEMLQYSCTNNYITYTDSSGVYGQIIADGEFWAPDGSGRATTITFNPSYEGNKVVYRMDEAIVNDMTYGNGSVAQSRIMEGALIENNQCYFKNASINGGTTGYTYNRVRQSIGDVLEPSSQTYRNSSFTVFILFTQKDGTTVADVNGSFNGTNVYEGAVASMGSGTITYVSPDSDEVIQGDGGTTQSQYTSSDLSGSGNLGGATNLNNDIVDYQQQTYIDNLQKEHEFEYYSTLKAAVDDVNNSTIGAHADVDKEDAVAGIYVDGANITVVLLQDHDTQESIVTKKTMTIMLGGNKLSGTNIYVVGNTEGILTIDGRIDGSTINAIANDKNMEISCVRTFQTINIFSGEYICNGECKKAIPILCKTSTSKNNIISNATITMDVYAEIAYGIQSGNNSKIINCDIMVKNSKLPSIDIVDDKAITVGIYGTSNNTIDNCDVSVFGHSGRYIDGSNHNYWSPTIGIRLHEDNNVIISNCKVRSNIAALHTQSVSNTTVLNCTLFGGAIACSLNNSNKVLLENCDLISDGDYCGYAVLDERTSNTINLEASTVTVNDCILNAKQNSTYAIKSFSESTIYISNIFVQSSKPIQLTSNSTIYLGARSHFSEEDVLRGTVIKTNTTYNTAQ